MPEILYDEEAMRKVVTNLLSNAIKFTPNGGTVSLYLSALFAKDSEKETLYICVKDSGSGIPEEDLNRIFNRFYQSQNQVKYPVYGQEQASVYTSANGLFKCTAERSKHSITVMRDALSASSSPCNGMKGKTKRQSLLITTIRPQFLFRIPALQKRKRL